MLDRVMTPYCCRCCAAAAAAVLPLLCCHQPRTTLTLPMPCAPHSCPAAGGQRAGWRAGQRTAQRAAGGAGAHAGVQWGGMALSSLVPPAIQSSVCMCILQCTQLCEHLIPKPPAVLRPCSPLSPVDHSSAGVLCG